jgi:hypothetical protein
MDHPKKLGSFGFVAEKHDLISRFACGNGFLPPFKTRAMAKGGP